jgi:hypothetical protein
LRTLALFITVFTAWQVHASAVCGLYQIEDFGDREIVSIVDFRTHLGGLNWTYIISNPEDPVVRGMVTSRCYCVEGLATVDPEFAGDILYQRLKIERVFTEPYVGCGPTPPKRDTVSATQ